MATAVSISSNAMLRLGADPISSFDEADLEGSNIERARLAANLWPTVRKEVLRAHPWNCAIARVLLSPDEVAPAFGYTNRFLLPSDWLRTLQVGETPESLLEFQPEGRYLLANESALPLVYVFDNDNPGTYDALLVGVMEAAMAASLAYPVTKSAAAVERFAAEYEAKAKKARATDGQDAPPETLGDSRLYAGRFGNR
jgi:hypothetical protein